MGMMESFHHSDALPEQRKSKNPAENKNHDFMVQAMLMSRSNFREDEWVERYAAAFRKLFNTDESFRELVNDEISDQNLKQVQERLDAEAGQH
jgi:hypothetical protein